MFRILKIIIIPVILLLYGEISLFCQQSVIRGTVTDTSGRPLEKASVTIESSGTGIYTSEEGAYSFSVPRNNSEITLSFSFIGYRAETRSVICNSPVILLDVILNETTGKIDEVTVSGESRSGDLSLSRISVKDIKLLPSASGSFEAILKTQPGVASNTELSSQYSVRGGNYDENLVYVNDIEVYKPFLIRSGQQEGMSFINPDLISSVSFSSGGFGASYGDKMSSVLDIRYKNPAANRGSVSMGLLSSTAHIEGMNKTGKFSWIAGTRYRSTKMMLNTMDSEGDYQPVFFDMQSLFRYKTGKNSELSLLATFSSNTYNFIPQSRTSTFGTEALAYRLYVLFDGAEKDRYQTGNTVLSWEIRTRNDFSHKFLLSSFFTREKESFDIRGFYSMSTLDKTSGSENFSDTLMNIGIGSFLNHARNRLSVFIQSAAYKGARKSGKYQMEWGLRLRHDNIRDRIREWTLIDSAGFSIPYRSESLVMSSLISVKNNLNNIQGESYFQMERLFHAATKEIRISGGIRGTYNSYTDEVLISPRISARIKATDRFSYKLAAGIYYQPPFYREMRYPDGSLNISIRSQESIHTVAGLIYDFKAWERPFRFSAEVYNKTLRNIIPYKLDNVRLIYSGDNIASGFSRGIDLRLNGEFVEDAESWISVSVMDSRLRIPGVLDDYFPAPFDQTFSASIFFQDYLPGYPTWRAHINIAYATGIPVVSPFNNRYDQFHRLPDYRRIDLGITKVIKGKGSVSYRGGILTRFEEVIAGLEVFNLIDINNTISYYWVKTINNLSGKNRQFAIPDYLTGRSLNFKLMATF